MFYSDRPITNKDGDCLNRTIFSKELAQAILSYTKIDNFTIGLCGKWGCGKTSIINMVVDEIKENTAKHDISEKPIIVMFNPWNYSDCTQLIDQFFQTIINELSLNDPNQNLRSVGDALKKYSSIFHYTSYIPVVGKYLGPIVDLLSSAGEHMTERAEENDTLVKQKNIVIEALQSQKRKFIVIIDDIDRLNNEQIRLIFQLVNSLAGFPNMIYLLSFDKSVVSRALAEEQNCKGEEYLEKIIQVPFDVPQSNKNLIKEVFCRRVESIMDEYGEDENFDSDYWQIVFPECILPFLNTMRDVNRIINVFEFKYGLLKQEINLIDLLALTTVQICAQPIFDWINSNIYALTGSVLSSSGISVIEQKENSKKYIEKFTEIYPESPERMLKILQCMFPRLCWSTGGYFCCYDSESELMFKQRVASKDRSQRYFNLSMEEIVFDRKKMLQVASDMEIEELREYFSYLIENKVLYEFLHELMVYTKEIPSARRLMFVRELLQLQVMPINKEKTGWLSPSASYQSSICMYKILKENSKQDNLTIINNVIETCDIQQLSYVCEIVEQIERAYGQIGKGIESTLQFIDESDIEEVERNILVKIKLLSENYCLMDCEGFSCVRLIWRYIEKETLDEYIKQQIENPINVPKLILLIANTWTGSRGHGWSFDEKSFEEDYISAEDAYKKILSLKHTKDFVELDQQFKDVAVAYSIWYDQEKTEFNKVSKDDVDAVISEWLQVEV